MVNPASATVALSRETAILHLKFLFSLTIQSWHNDFSGELLDVLD
jgi:hypothetical protein